MIISQQGIDFIKSWEGLELSPYKDSAGKDTIGYGHLIMPGEQFGTITKDQAEIMLRDDIERAEAKVRARVFAPQNQDQYDALVSLAFNVPDALYGGTVEDKINGGVPLDTLEKVWKAWNKVRDNKGNLVVSNGLVRRRNAEWDIYTTGHGGIVTTLKKNHSLLVAIAVVVILILIIKPK